MSATLKLILENWIGEFPEQEKRDFKTVPLCIQLPFNVERFCELNDNLLTHLFDENQKLRNALKVPADDFLKGDYGIGHELFEMVCNERDDAHLKISKAEKIIELIKPLKCTCFPNTGGKAHIQGCQWTELQEAISNFTSK